MKRKLLLILVLAIGFTSFAQFTTGTVTLTTGMTLKIDTNATTVTLTLTGPNTTWLGVGFGGNSMGTVSDMFIWNSTTTTTTNSDYTSCDHCTPTPDLTQSWSVNENVSSNIRTVVATRNLATGESGDYTFTNDGSDIEIIYALSNTTTLSQHNGPHAPTTLNRSALGVEDFSLDSNSAIYPNPSNGNFTVKTKTGLSKINVYSQSGSFLRTIDVNDNSNNVEVNINGLQSGVYLIELQNEKEKSWKKVVIN